MQIPDQNIVDFHNEQATDFMKGAEFKGKIAYGRLIKKWCDQNPNPNLTFLINHLQKQVSEISSALRAITSIKRDELRRDGQPMTDQMAFEVLQDLARGGLRSMEIAIKTEEAVEREDVSE